MLSNEKVLEKINEKFESAILESSDSFGDISLLVTNTQFFPLVKFLKEDSNLDFDQLADLCAVDYPRRDKRFQCVTHLFSNKNNVRVRIKVDLAMDEYIESLTPLYQAANWPERESWDLMGIKYKNHPNLTRIMNTDDFVGHPMRKDYPVRGTRDPRYKELLKAGKI